MSNGKRTIDLYELLPAVYRIWDAKQKQAGDRQSKYQLKALLDIISDQADIVKLNIDGLWDDFFIETCAEWVIPYIGYLVGNNPLHMVTKGRRADVAKTIYYRRRKGTLPILEELARDVTGWKARAAEFFRLLEWTQHTNHNRFEMTPNPGRKNPNAVDYIGTVNVRNLDALDRLDGPFDVLSHTVDVRPTGPMKGWHNIRNVGFFIWRLQAYPMCKVRAHQSSQCAYGYYASPLGNPAPMFTNAEREAEETKLATELHVPGRIRALALARDLHNCRVESVTNPGQVPVSSYYGREQDDPVSCDAHASFTIWDGDRYIPPQSIVCMNLKNNWMRPPESVEVIDADGHVIDVDIEVGIDVSAGRLAFAEGKEPDGDVAVHYHYGFSADIGGGPYERRATRIDSAEAELTLTVRHGTLDPDEFATIGGAIQEWIDQGRPNCIIRIADSRTYDESIAIDVGPGSGDRWLAIEAENDCRPTLRILGAQQITLTGTGQNVELIFNGLLIEGGIHISGNLGVMRLRHCTLVPGFSLTEEGEPGDPSKISIEAISANPELEIEIDHCIVGAMLLPRKIKGLMVADSIVDGLENAAICSSEGFGPLTTIERSTIFGQVEVKTLHLASEVIFRDTVIAERTQEGCVRYSHVSEDSRIPQKYRCQPSLALTKAQEQASSTGIELTSTDRERIASRLRPRFTSVRYGDPAYCQLSHHCAAEIKTGAEDGSEMGVFRHLRQPQRETNLSIRLEEYLPFGLTPGFIYVT